MMVVTRLIFFPCVADGAGSGDSEEAAGFWCWQKLFIDQRRGQYTEVVGLYNLLEKKQDFKSKKKTTNRI